MVVAYDYKQPKNTNANFYVIFGVCPKYEVDLTQSSGKSKPPLIYKKNIHVYHFMKYLNYYQEDQARQ